MASWWVQMKGRRRESGKTERDGERENEGEGERESEGVLCLWRTGCTDAGEVICMERGSEGVVYRQRTREGAKGWSFSHIKSTRLLAIVYSTEGRIRGG